MNVQEAISFLTRKGWKVYLRDGLYSAWHPTSKNNSVMNRYSERGIIKLAEANKAHKIGGHKGTLKVGPGGVNCPCCAPPMEVVKKITRRKERRNSLKDLTED